MGQRITPERGGNAFTDIDLDAAGRHVGSLMVPHSPDDDAWGVTRIPLAVVGNGDGPTVILEGGNHGDEYEGPIVISELIRDLDPAEVHGRLILMPANNVHAVRAGKRTSSVDGLNYNRVFPGDPLGTITEQIVAYLCDHILPRGDAFMTLHSGGSSLAIMPSAIIEPAADTDLHRRNIEAVLAFDAPTTVVISNLGDPRTATASAVRAGLVTVGTEMGGGGNVSLEAMPICRRGVANVLAHLGVLQSAPQKVAGPSAEERNILELPGSSAFVYATTDGVFEPFHPLGTGVSAGQEAGRIHWLWDPGRDPETVRYQADGIVYALRQPGRVQSGNCCAVVAAPYKGNIL